MKNYKCDQPCCVCGSELENGIVWHHIKSRGARGGDEDFNLMPLCKAHHAFVHTIGRSNSASRFAGFKKFLIDNGWTFSEFNNKWSRQ